MATAKPEIGNTLRISGSKGEATKGVTRHLERGQETGFLPKTKSFQLLHKNEDCPKARQRKSSLVDAIFKRTGEGIYTMISRVVVVRHLGGLFGAVSSICSLINNSSLHPWQS